MTSDLPSTGAQQTEGQQPPNDTSIPPAGPTPPQPTPPGPTPPGPTTASTAGTAPRHGADEFFDRIRSLGVYRPDDGRWGAGVAAGLARRWDIDPLLIRGGFVALTLFGGIGVVAYGLGWLFLPQQDGRIHLQQAFRGDITAGFVGAVILSLAAIGGGGGHWHRGVWFSWGFPGGLLLTIAVVLGIWWLARRSNNPPPPPGGLGTQPSSSTWTSSATGTTTPPDQGSPSGYRGGTSYSSASGYQGAPAYGTPAGATGWQQPTPPGTTGQQAKPDQAQRDFSRAQRDFTRARSAPSRTIVRVSLGVALLTAAAVIVAGRQGDWSAPYGVVAAATALAVLAGGVIISGLRGRRASGLVGISLLLAIGSLAGAGAHQAGVRAGQSLAVVGSQQWRPSTGSAADRQFNLGVGEATLWLTDPAILVGATPSDPLRISARVGAGHLLVQVPQGVATTVNVQIGAGEVVQPDGTTVQVNGKRGKNGQVEHLTTGPAGTPLLIVTIQQGVGQLEIRTTPSTAATPTAPATPAKAVKGVKAPKAVRTVTTTN